MFNPFSKRKRKMKTKNKIMKKFIFAIIITSIALISISSCKKEDQSIMDNSNGKYTENALNIWNRLNSFNNKMKDGNSSRDIVLVPADSVIWYLENMLNIQLSVDTSFSTSDKYRENYTLDLDENGFVAMSELTTLYNQMESDIENQLGQIESDYKYLLIADLYEENSRSGDMEIALDGIYATGRFMTYTPFTEDDNWYYGHMLGREDGSYLYQSDAIVQLAMRINNQGIKPTFQYNTWLDPIQSPNNIGSPSNDRMFYEVAASAPVIEHNDMLTYLMSWHYLVYNSSSDIPYGYFPTGPGYEDYYFHLVDYWTNEQPPSDNKYWHGMDAFYGVPVYMPPIN